MRKVSSSNCNKLHIRGLIVPDTPDPYLLPMCPNSITDRRLLVRCIDTSRRICSVSFRYLRYHIEYGYDSERRILHLLCKNCGVELEIPMESNRSDVTFFWTCNACGNIASSTQIHQFKSNNTSYIVSECFSCKSVQVLKQ